MRHREAAAVILVALPNNPDESYSGIKGAADAPRGTLALTPGGPFKDSDTIRLTYQLDRDAFLVVAHARELGADSTVLFNDRLPAAPAGNGRFPLSGGHLGYSFDCLTPNR